MAHEAEATGHPGAPRGHPTPASAATHEPVASLAGAAGRGTVGTVRALGVDLGTRRIGLALSDSGGRVATPLEVLERSGVEAQDHAAIAAVATEREAEIVVVGLPLSLDGSMGPAARAASAEIGRLANVVEVPVATCDERLSTVSAQQHLRAGEVRSARRRQVVDMVAAAVVLQTWLDAHREAQSRP